MVKATAILVMEQASVPPATGPACAAIGTAFLARSPALVVMAPEIAVSATEEGRVPLVIPAVPGVGEAEPVPDAADRENPPAPAVTEAAIVGSAMMMSGVPPVTEVGGHKAPPSTALFT